VSPAAELAHRRLCDLVWAGGEWPANDVGSLAQLGRLPAAEAAGAAKELAKLGWRRSGRLLWHPAVAGVRREAVRWLRTRRRSCRVAARSRWQDTREKGDASAMRDACVTHTSRNASPMRQLCTVNSNSNSNSTDNTVNTGERLTLAALPHEKGATEAEKNYLGEVASVMERWKKGASVMELHDWGAWWRVLFRRNPKKARAVLADVAVMVKEGRISGTPGAAAMDLSKRLPE